VGAASLGAVVHPGSALILFTSYFQVQVSVAINSWYGPFYDFVQAALSKSRPVTVEQFYSELSTFAGTMVAVTSESAECSQTPRQSSTKRPNRPDARSSRQAPP
jgi:hypothetical protein